MASLGRGVLYLMAANIVYLSTGYLIHVGLARILGPASYGIFGVVIYLFTLGDTVLNSGVPGAASKYIAEDNSKAIAIKNKALKMQLFLAFAMFAIFFLLARVFANVLGDSELTLYIRISALIIPAASLFWLYRGIKEKN